MTIAMLLTLHLICVALSVSLFVARYWWIYCCHALAASRWTLIVPHVIYTMLLLSGIGL
ncbi:SirB2 family protein, partial [Salmonella enterica subsp. enterica serovar Weltevreden]|uniref:SirB2 family protein n=1 Tax=Salmonella enterica TaxID=28901 RepID=UPI001F1D1995